MNHLRLAAVMVIVGFVILGGWCVYLKSHQAHAKPQERMVREVALDEADSDYIYECIYDLTEPDTMPARNYVQYFDDVQDVQIESAMALGVEPGTPFDGGAYVEIVDNDLYYLENVTLPYLVPDAAELLTLIAKMYQQEVNDTTARLRVSSALRTPESVDKLTRRNRNAVSNSCHLYGTTIDISYSPLDVSQKAALARVLAIIRHSGYCHVKYERKQPCFHITISRHPDKKKVKKQAPASQ